MADIAGLTINAKIEISEETVRRCCELLSIYLEDHPDKMFYCSNEGGPGRPCITIWNKREFDECQKNIYGGTL